MTNRKLFICCLILFFASLAPAAQISNAEPLVTIDPTYAWHTFYGSADWDEGFSVATDGSGNIYVTGDTRATWTGPAGQSPLHAHSGGWDSFVLKLDSNGAYQWHTFYGSSNSDFGQAITIDGSGNVYVMGYGDGSWNGPAGESPLHAFSIGTAGSADIFVLKLDSNGAYQWHTFYGSSDFDDAYNGIATDGNGNVYIMGTSFSTWNGPAGQNPLHAHSGFYDVFVLKLNSSGFYQWHTFYGSSDPDFDGGILADASGNIYVTGCSEATWNGPAGESPLHVYSGYRDIFVLKLDSNGSYRWHTFYGQTDYDYGFAIATDGSGNLYVTGGSNATWKGPAGQSPLHVHSESADIFVLKLDSSGTYQWHTFYGSSGSDKPRNVATDGGNVYVTGYSNGTWNGPAGQDPLHAYSGNDDIFVLKLDSSGAYQWHTFYGASDDEYGDYSYGIATDGKGNVYATGGTYAWNGPAGESPLHAYSGLHDIFVLKLAESSTCIEPFISSHPQSETIQSGQTATMSVSASGAAPLTYQWYQGPSGNTSTPVGTNSSSYKTPALNQTTSYWVRVVNSCGSADSNTANITVQVDISDISVVSPKGGETWPARSTQKIRWTYTSNLDSSVKVELLKGGVVNRTIASFASKGSGGSGSFNWKIPAKQAPGTDYRIRVTSTNGAYTDTSDSDFIIVAPLRPTISLVTPNGGDTLRAGSTQAIRWTYFGNSGPYVKIELLKGGTVNRRIATLVSRGSGGTGSFNWKIPAKQAPGTDYRIRVTSTHDGAYTDTSDSDFTIAAPTITVISPNGGEIFTTGTTQTIRWNYTGNPGSYVKIELLKGGVINRNIKSFAFKKSRGNGSYNWRIPLTQTEGNDYQIRVTSTSNGSYSDRSDSNFTISK